MTAEEIKERLMKTEKGAVKNNRQNCMLVLENDPLLKDAFRYNILTGRVDIVRKMWWPRQSEAQTDMDLNYIMLYLEETYGLTMDKNVQKCIDLAADQHRYHPIRDYLNALEWDGTERIPHVLHRYFGAPDDELTAESMKMLLMGAISRVFWPGIKFEYVLCIIGGQGIGKSSFFRLLAVQDDWFTDDVKKLDDENVYRRLRGHWIVELSEMVATARSKSVEETKSFISRQKDNYKDLYALHAEDRPRQCVFVGSSNRRKFLPFDRTGNRRFIPVQADKEAMEAHVLDDELASRAYMNQVWAEAMEIWRRGDYRLSFSKETEAQLDELRREYMAEDTDAGIIQAWLDEHRDRRVCSMMLYREALDNRYTKPKKAETDAICDIMNTVIVGWKPGPTTRFEQYGTQRSWEFVNEPCKREEKNFFCVSELRELTDEECPLEELPMW